jgi:hypothetical protein
MVVLARESMGKVAVTAEEPLDVGNQCGDEIVALPPARGS